jgi:tetratricopeptide (TPR) repeat protein
VGTLRFAAAVLIAVSPLLAFAGDAGGRLIRQGESEMQAGRIEEAVATLERAVAENPESSLAYTRLGGAQILTQAYGAGIESFKRAISLDATNADAFVGMAVAYLHTGRYALARAALVEAKTIDTAKADEVDDLIAWIDERSESATPEPAPE